MNLKKLKKSLLAIVLSVAMVAQSVAAEEIVDVSGSDIIVTEADVDVSEGDETEDVSGNDDEGNQEVSDEDIEDENSEEEESEDVSDGDLEEIEVEIDENDISWINFPDGNILSQEDLELKTDLATTVKDMKKYKEGVHFAASEVFALVDSEEDAEFVADVYGSEIENYSDGVVILDLPDSVSTEMAVKAAANKKYNLPNVYPNFYRYEDTADWEAIANSDEPYYSVSQDEVENEEESAIEEDADVIDYDIVDPDSVSDNDEIDDLYIDELPDAYTELDGIIPSTGNTDPFLSMSSPYYQWHHQVLGSAYAWENGITGSGVKVGVLDTGVNPTSGELVVSGNWYSSTDGVYSAGDPSGGSGHGTNVAGLIGAKKNNSIMGSGIAPDCQIYNYRVLGTNGGSDAGIIRGINAAVSDGMDVINMSLGGYGYSSSYLKVLANAKKKGTVVVVAAGNEGGSAKAYPAGYPDVICVGATDKSNVKVYFSNFGTNVDVAAPGVDMHSTNKSGSTTVPVTMSGTSQATPCVAGVVALMISAPTANSYISGVARSKRVATIESKLKSSCVKAGSGTGRGIVSIPKALKLTSLASKPSTPSITVGEPVANSGYFTRTVTLTVKQTGMRVYYTTDGKKPSFSKGVLKRGTYAFKSTTSNKSYTFTLDSRNAKQVKIYAIAVNDNGLVSKVGGKTVKLTTYVTAISVAGKTYVKKGTSATYKATITPSYASNKSVSWSVTNPSGATVKGVKIDKNGKLTVAKSVSPQTVYVKATAKDGSGKTYSRAVYIVAANPVKSSKFTQKTITIQRTGTTNVTIDLTPYFTYSMNDSYSPSLNYFNASSSKESVATVAKTATSIKVTALKKGSTTIKMAPVDTSGKSASIVIKVVDHATSLSITTGRTYNNKTYIQPGKSLSLNATFNPYKPTNASVTWKAKDAANNSIKGVSISKSGVLKVGSKVSRGTKIIVTCTAKDGGLTATKEITVATGKIKTVKFTNQTGTMFRDTKSSTSVDVTITGTTGFDKNAIEITNSDASVASMTKTLAASSDTSITYRLTFTATGSTNGYTTVSIKTYDGSGVKASKNMNVRERALSVTVGSADANRFNYIAKGGAGLKLKAVAQGNGAMSSMSYTWTVGTNYANSASTYHGISVSSKGVVKASSKATLGTYYVYAKTNDGSNVVGSYKIEVINKCTSLYIYWGWYRYTQVRLKPGYYDYYYLGGSGTCKDVVCTSSNPGVAGACFNGGYVLFFGYKQGTAVITIKDAAGNAQTKVTVTVY